MPEDPVVDSPAGAAVTESSEVTGMRLLVSGRDVSLVFPGVEPVEAVPVTPTDVTEGVLLLTLERTDAPGEEDGSRERVTSTVFPCEEEERVVVVTEVQTHVGDSLVTSML